MIGWLAAVLASLTVLGGFVVCHRAWTVVAPVVVDALGREWVGPLVKVAGVAVSFVAVVLGSLILLVTIP